MLPPCQLICCPQLATHEDSPIGHVKTSLQSGVAQWKGESVIEKHVSETRTFFPSMHFEAFLFGRKPQQKIKTLVFASWDGSRVDWVCVFDNLVVAKHPED